MTEYMEKRRADALETRVNELEWANEALLVERDSWHAVRNREIEQVRVLEKRLTASRFMFVWALTCFVFSVALRWFL